MPFAHHQEFIPPEDESAPIWRYMDISKFLSLLDKASLYFARVDYLWDLDPAEGHYTEANIQIENLTFDELPNEQKISGEVSNENDWKIQQKGIREVREFIKKNCSVTFVNCWQYQVHESTAMWNEYVNNGQGVAIQSTFSRLKESISKYQDFNVNIGMIKYLDYTLEAIPVRNLILPFMSKRKNFEHERELRALIWTLEDNKNSFLPAENKFSECKGLDVPVNLTLLIESIHLAPTAPSWHHELIQSLVKRFGLNVPVVPSALAKKNWA